MKNIVCLYVLFLSLNAYASIIPTDGLWGTTDNPTIGSGLMLTTQGGITVVSVFTYDDDGENIWYLASGQVDDEGVLEADLLLASNGTHILSDHPASAQFTGTPRKIKLEFSGSQVGTLSIDESEVKSIQASHFGFGVWPTEQVQLADNSFYQFPWIDGKWVLGDVGSGESTVLDLAYNSDITNGSPPLPNNARAYLSDHPNSDNWSIYCPVSTINSEQPYCRVRRSNDQSFPEMRIDLADLGNQRMTIYQNSVEPFEKYQAFRLNNDRRLLPNDGYWRPADDPAIGSGLVMRTQEKYTVILLYSYDDEGNPGWQIASGQFDEHGQFTAELLEANGGSSIDGLEPVSATYSDQIDQIEIQLQGSELATFSINGSTPKNIQNFNFGNELHNTDMFRIEDQRYVFPDMKGEWVIINENFTATSVWNIAGENPNCCQSPPDPNYFDSVGYTNWPGYSSDDGGLHFSISLNCVKSQIPYSNYEYPETSFCYGSNYSVEENKLIKIYFEDIGVNEFRYYIGERNPLTFYGGYYSISRDSSYYQLFRLSQ